MSIIKSFFSTRFKRSIKDRLGVPSLHWSLQNLKKAGLTPNFAIDGGAYIGEWTAEYKEVFPDSKVLMIEAQSSKEAILKSVCENFLNVNYHMALLAAKDNQELSFVENETISYTSLNPSIQTNEKKLSMTLNSIIEMNNYPYPDFIKLDVQGYEIEVLKGASKCLENSEICMLEVSIFDWGDRFVPLIPETLNFMNEHNFMAYDISHISRRPYDHALNQIDMFFVKKNSKLIALKNWS